MTKLDQLSQAFHKDQDAVDAIILQRYRQLVQSGAIVPPKRNVAKISKEFVILKGGPGSGHHGHSGRPGKRGGSLPGIGGSFSNDVDSRLEIYGELRDAAVARGGLDIKTIDEVKTNLAKKYGLEEEYSQFREDLLQWTGDEFSADSPLLQRLERAVAGNPDSVTEFNKVVNDQARDLNHILSTGNPYPPDSLTVYRGGDADSSRSIWSVTRSASVAQDFAQSYVDNMLEGEGSASDYIESFSIPVSNIWVDFGLSDIGGRWGEDEILVDMSGIDVYKGGAGSGHHGHRGRPGKRGGSLPGTGSVIKIRLGNNRTISTDPLSQNTKIQPDELQEMLDSAARGNYAEIEAQWQEWQVEGLISNDMELRDFIHETFSSFESDGLRVEVTRLALREGGDEIGISAKIVNAKGEMVGGVARAVERDVHGQISVYHDQFSLNSEYQGSGFGARFLQNAEEQYMAAGFNSVYLEANFDVGGYAWARMGYDFSNSTERAKYNNELQMRVGSFYEELLGAAPPPEVPAIRAAFDSDMGRIGSLAAYEIAAFTPKWNNSARIGKQTLLGAGWEAEKILDISNPGYQAGLAYYRARFGEETVLKGGPGSGHHGHSGRPGKRGGSLPGKGTTATPAPLAAPTFSIEEIDMDMEVDGEKLIYTMRTWGDGSAEEHDKAMHALFWGKENEPSPSRAEDKDRIVKELTEKTDMDYDEANAYVKQWAHSSNDTDMRSLGVQRAAAEEFGTELSEWQKEQIKRTESRGTNDGSNQGLFTGYGGWKDEDTTLTRQGLRATYEQTQSRLREMGIGPDDKVTLYRGMRYRGGEISKEARTVLSNASETKNPIDYTGNAIESWTISPAIARRFGGPSATRVSAVLITEVPARNIVSTARTGFGCWPEEEVVIFGNVPGSQVAVDFFHVGDLYSGE